MLIHGVALVYLYQSFRSEHHSAASYKIQVKIVTPNVNEFVTTDTTLISQKKSDSPIVSNLSRMPAKASVTEFEANMAKKGTNQSAPYYFPSYLLDRVPVPISAPNPTKHLMNSVVSISPIRLRLYIEASGKVSKIDTLSANIYNENLIESLKNMFYETSFIAGNRRGNDVASYIDIEIGLSEAER